MITDQKSKVAIVGAGPAGSSLAIRLSQRGFETIVIEREKFPRHKLCGEFISPECLRHFRDLKVLDSMLGAGGDRVYETRFFEKGGRSISVPSKWFGQGDFALSLSRAEMDHQLLERARACGAVVFEKAMISDIESSDGSVRRLKVRTDTEEFGVEADIFIDATGRGGALTRLALGNHASGKPPFVGFKAHIAGADLPMGVCEIYSFPGGYAGLSNVENDVSNLCFLLKSEVVRDFSSDANEIVKAVVCRNKRARETLGGFSKHDGWTAVAVSGFGTKKLAPAVNLFTVGDAAAFIDPFTGSGMLMAMESAELLAEAIGTNFDKPPRIATAYEAAYRQKFRSRLRVCSALRRTAFLPGLATAVVTSLGFSGGVRKVLARATRK